MCFSADQRCNVSEHCCKNGLAVFIITLRYNPTQATFDARMPEKCLSDTAVLVSIVSWGIVCDLVIWALTIPTVWRLHLPVANKIALSILFCASRRFHSISNQASTNNGRFSVVAIGIVRITTVYNIDYKDFSFSSTTASNWAFAESGIANRHNDCVRTSGRYSIA